MKILVIGGMHGNEPLGIELVKLLRVKPVVGVDTVLANEAAIKARTRFVKNDLNRSFPGHIKAADYEARRAAELLALAADYDLVLDFHNTHCPENDCGFVGEAAQKHLYEVAARVGLKRIIVADYDCVNKYAPNCLSVEISLDSRQMDPRGWRRRLIGLTRQPQAVAGSRTATETYRFVYRMSLEDRDRLDLAARKLRAFKPLASDLASQMNVQSPAYPIFVGDSYTPYNYGGLLNKIDV